jgi:hypothetical protein
MQAVVDLAVYVSLLLQLLRSCDGRKSPCSDRKAVFEFMKRRLMPNVAKVTCIITKSTIGLISQGLCLSAVGDHSDDTVSYRWLDKASRPCMIEGQCGCCIECLGRVGISGTEAFTAEVSRLQMHSDLTELLVSVSSVQSLL